MKNILGLACDLLVLNNFDRSYEGLATALWKALEMRTGTTYIYTANDLNQYISISNLQALSGCFHPEFDGEFCSRDGSRDCLQKAKEIGDCLVKIDIMVKMDKDVLRSRAPFPFLLAPGIR